MSARMELRKQRRAAHTRKTKWMASAGILAVGVVGVLLWLSTTASTPPSGTLVSAGRTWGQANAPVAIEIFSDFQ